MLHWLLNEHNKYWFLLELILMSIVLHGILGVLLFVVYPTKRDSFCIELGKAKAPTLFMPLRNAMSKGVLATSQCGAGTCSAMSSSQLAQPMAEQGLVMHKAQLSSDVTIGFQEKKLTKQTMPKKRPIQSKKDTPRVRKKKDTRNVRKPVQPAKRSKKIVEKVVPKKKQPEKKELPKNIKKEVKEPIKPIQPQAPHPESKLKDAPASKKQEIVQEQSIQKHIAQHEQQVAFDAISLEQVVLGNEPVDGEYISSEQARMYEYIEQEIVSHWRPPRGLSKDLVCHIKCSINNEGVVVSCSTEKSSGVLVYDMAARMASLALKLPRWAWGKDFTIVYKQ